MSTKVREDTVILQIDSAYGPISRIVQKTSPRDARQDEIAIIDVSGMFSHEISKRQAVANEVRRACSQMGFFYIVNHGIPRSTTQALEKASKDFFHQSVEQKNKASFDQLEGFHGPKEDQLNKYESADVFERLKVMYRPSMDPNPSAINAYEPFPWDRTTSVPLLEPSVKESFSARILLARKLLGSFALALNLDEAYFEAKIAEPQAALTLNYYPSGQQGEKKTESAGLGSHTDFGLVTLLSQDDAGGLQILSPEGEWVWAKPIPGSLVCNVGDMMTMITGGKFVSNIHRAKTESSQERFSIPFFFGFGPNTKIEVVETCDEPGRDKQAYEGVTAGDWLRKRIIAVKAGKQEIK